MLEPGDVVRYTGNISSWRNKEFTVISKYVPRVDTYGIRSNRMSYQRYVRGSDLVQVESIPKHTVGSTMEIKYPHGNILGIVVASNQYATLMRTQELEQHAIRFVQNSKIRKIK